MILYIHFGYLAKFDILYKKDSYLQQIIEKDTGIKWKIKINDKEYIVKESDDISKIAKQNGMSIKQIVIDNFWLVEKDRIEFK